MLSVSLCVDTCVSICMHACVYLYVHIHMCDIYMFVRRVCIHTRVPYFSEFIENRPFLDRGFNHAYIRMFYCVLYVIWNTYCFNAFYWTCGIRIILLVFAWYVDYVLSACLFFAVFYLLVLGQKWPNGYVQTTLCTNIFTRYAECFFYMLGVFCYNFQHVGPMILAIRDRTVLTWY